MGFSFLRDFNIPLYENKLRRIDFMIKGKYVRDNVVVKIDENGCCIFDTINHVFVHLKGPDIKLSKIDEIIEVIVNQRV